MPGLIWSKSHLPESLWGTSYDHMMHVTDWLPTLMSAVGGELTGRCVIYLFCGNRAENRGGTTSVPGLCSSKPEESPRYAAAAAVVARESLDDSDGSSSVNEGRRLW